MKNLLLTFLSLFLISNVVQSQVLINEVLADPGHYDGQGGEWFELYNAGAVAADVSCWTVTDGEYIVVLPNNTSIPANGHLLVYNSNFFGTNSGNWDTSLINNLPATTIAIDLVTCGCINRTAANCNAMILANSSSSGERLVLFDGNANIMDALAWGASGPAIAENVYATGPNTFAGDIVGTNAGCSLAAANNYDLPATSDPVYHNLGAAVTGCTTSWIRANDGDPIWTSDEWPTPGQSNGVQDYTFSYAVDNGPSVDMTNQSSVTINVCPGTVLDFSSDIFAFNQVYNSNSGDIGNQEGGSSRGGSNIDATGGLTLTDVAWSEAPITSSGVTNLSYTTAPINSNTVIDLYIKENTQGVSNTNSNNSGCAAAGSNIVGSGAAGNCYVIKEVIVNITDTISSISYTCNNGLVTVTTVPASNFGSYTLNLTNTVNAALDQTFSVTNSPYSFQITQGNAADYSLTAQGQNPSCTSTMPSVTGSGLCVFAPPCPTLVDTSCSTPSGAACPGDSISLGVNLSSQNLSDGMTIEWVLDTDNDNDVYDEMTSAVIAVQTVTGGAPACPGGGSNVFISELSEPLNGWQTNRYVEIYNAGPCSQDLSGWTLEIIGNNLADRTAVLSGTLLAGQAAFIGNTTGFIGTIDPSALQFDIGTSSIANFNGQSRDGAILFNGSTVVDVAVINTGDNNDWFENSTIARTNCAPTGPALGSGTGSTLCGGSTTTCADLTTNWGSLTSVTPTPGTHTGCTPAGGISVTPNCIQYGVPLTACNDTLRIKPRVSPNQTGCLPGSPTPTLATRIYTVTCPLAKIDGQSAICSSNNTEFPVVISNYGNCTGATVYYSLNGGPSISSGLLSIVNDTALVTGISQAGVYTLDSVIFSGCSINICQAEVQGDHTVLSLPNPAKPIVSQPASACIGQTAQLSAIGGPDVNWYDDASLNNLIGSGNQINFIAGAATQTLYLKVVDPNDGCESDTTQLSVVGNTPPLVTASALNGSICLGESDTLQTVNGPGLLWITSDTTSTVVVSPTVQTIYTVQKIDSNGCYGFDTTLVIVDDIPLAPASVVCANNMVTITPANPSCTNSNCSIEYSPDGMNWSADSVYTSTDLGWAGFGPGDTLFVRNASAAMNGNDCITHIVNPCPMSIPLPLESLFLQGYLLNNTAYLHWETISERNVNHFEVMKLNERNNEFERIGSVDAIGNSTSSSSYEFNDVAGFDALSTYVIQAIDVNGQKRLSNTLRLTNEAYQNKVIVYPTPAQEVLNIEIVSTAKQAFGMKLLDVNGRVLLEKSGNLVKGNNRLQLEVENLTNGIYYIQIGNELRKLYTGKVLISK